MLSRWVRTWDGKVLSPFLRGLAYAGVTPNALTLTSLAAFLCAGILFAFGSWLAAVWFIALGGLADSLDGELARVCGGGTPLGGFLDSICDHYGDFALYLGLLWWFLGHGPDRGAGLSLAVILIFAAMFGSVMGSQVRSRAAMVGIDTRWAGTFTRLERLVILGAGVLIGQVTPALAVLALMNNVSALQRVVQAVRNLKREE